MNLKLGKTIMQTNRRTTPDRRKAEPLRLWFMVSFSASYPWSKQAQAFMQKMAARLGFGLFRHSAPVKGAFDPKQDYLKRLKAELRRYETTGNTEHLINTANYCLLEFYNPLHPNAHYKNGDSGGYTE